MKRHQTQAERLFSMLRKRGMTTMQMLETGISVCPWRRLSEGIHHLKPGEYLRRRVNEAGRVVYRVVKA